jgi:hypothetical protein
MSGHREPRSVLCRPRAGRPRPSSQGASIPGSSTGCSDWPLTRRFQVRVLVGERGGAKEMSRTGKPALAPALSRGCASHMDL